MKEYYIMFLNRNIEVIYLVAVVIIVRLILRKAPKNAICLLWGLVGVRLICPFSIHSMLSIIPSNPFITKNTLQTLPQSIPVFNHHDIVGQAINAYSLNQTVNVQNPQSVLMPLSVEQIGAIIWMAGVIGLFLYGIISMIKLKERVKIAIPLTENIYQCDRITSAFVLGIIRPRIYLPFSLDVTSQRYVIAHEKAHIRNGDHLTKLLAFLLLGVYWFNPFVWIAYLLFCKDIELACDERVIKEIGYGEKKAYSSVLLACSVNKGRLAMSPLAFGEVDVKHRIKNILHYQKPKIYMILSSILAVLLIGICFMTLPPHKKNDDSSSFISKVSPKPTLKPTSIPSPTVASNPESEELLNEDGFIINDVSKNDIRILSADLDHDGTKEMISLDLSVYDFAQPAYIKVYKKNKLIWKEELFAANSDQNSFYLYKKGGKDYLLRYLPYCEQGGCNYSFEIFYLDKNSKKKIIKENHISFDTYNVELERNFDIPTLVQFYTEINSYLHNSIMLISTLNGELNHSTQDSFITKIEEFDFLDSYKPELVYNKKDKLADRLTKYREYVMKMKG